jgi:hypothetical protein
MPTGHATKPKVANEPFFEVFDPKLRKDLGVW